MKRRVYFDTSSMTAPGACPELMRPTRDVLVAASDMTSGEEVGVVLVDLLCVEQIYIIVSERSAGRRRLGGRPHESENASVLMR